MNIVEDVEIACRPVVQTVMAKLVSLAPDSWIRGGCSDPLNTHKYGVIRDVNAGLAASAGSIDHIYSAPGQNHNPIPDESNAVATDKEACAFKCERITDEPHR